LVGHASACPSKASAAR